MFRSFEEVLSFLDGLGMFHMDFGLDRMYRYLRFVSPAFIQVPKRRGNVSNR